MNSDTKPNFERNLIKTWQTTDLSKIELQRGFSVNRPVPRHWHEEYQFCLVENGNGDLTYRGKDFPTPPASLFIVHPGEVHSNRAFDQLGCSFRTIFLAPELMENIVTEMQNKSKGLPFFSSTIVFDENTIRQYVSLHKSLEDVSSKLERETHLQNFVANLINRFAENPFSTPLPRVEQKKILRACDYLIANYSENISLKKLASVAALSSFHFNRVFSEKFGMPPHAFQVQLRVNQAKKLLREGVEITHTACQTGFADQSHLTRHFKRIIGVTPGQYIQKQQERSRLFQ